MRILAPLLAAVLATATTAPALAVTSSLNLSPEARLAKALDGRVAGKPVDCLYQHDIRSSQIIDGTAILYDMGGGKLYVNYPQSGANFLRRDDVLVTDTHSDRLCSIDIVRLYDQGSHMQSGSIGLGKFIPYTKGGDRRH